MSELPILHIANKNYSSWSLRPWILMRVLGVPFEERLHSFNGPTAFTDFSPTGRVPCLHDGSLIVWDSLAIVEHLAESVPQVWPVDRAARAWARSATAEMHSGFSALREQCSMSCGVRIRLHQIDAALGRDLARLDVLWAEGLDRFGGPFLAGDAFTAVDAFFAPVAFRVLTYGLELSPTALDYAARLRGLPSMELWYRDGLAETIRDLPHDRDVVQWGVVTEDLRA
ncbi:MAG: glutathione S-transferase [Myxococcota bacterium]|jgi:glutathione S-transferase